MMMIVNNTKTSTFKGYRKEKSYMDLILKLLQLQH